MSTHGTQLGAAAQNSIVRTAATRQPLGMAASTALAKLPKSAQKVARQAASETGRRIRKKVTEERMVNTGLAIAASVGAALVDDKFRQGGEGEARFGRDDGSGGGFRPPVNAVVGGALLLAGLFGPQKYSGPALATGVGFAGPAVYAFTRMQLAKG